MLESYRNMYNLVTADDVEDLTKLVIYRYLGTYPLDIITQLKKKQFSDMDDSEQGKLLEHLLKIYKDCELYWGGIAEYAYIEDIHDIMTDREMDYKKVLATSTTQMIKWIAKLWLDKERPVSDNYKSELKIRVTTKK